MLHHMLRAAAQRAFSVLDPYFQYVTMLLHGDGTNGAQNNTFVDSSTNNFTITRNGNTTQGTFSPYGSNWSNYFDGSGDYLTTPQNSAFNFGTGAFTVEAFVYITASNGTNQRIIGLGDGAIGGGPYTGWSFNINNNLSQINWYRYDGTETDLNASYSFATNTWYHIVAVRNGSSNLSMFVNGSRVYNNASASLSYDNVNSNPLYIGQTYDGAGGGGYKYFNGYMSSVRIVDGAAVYDPTSSTLTVPTAPLTAVSGTSLLTCQSNRFVDNSTNAFTLTSYGNTSVQRFSPFAPTSAYSTSVIGGSGYFDGSGDYLTFATGTAVLGSSDFSIEAWVYPTSAITSVTLSSGQSDLATIAGSSWTFNLGSSSAAALYVGSGGDYGITSASPVINAWNHVVFCRTSGTISTYLNGNRVGTRADLGSSSVNTGSTSNPPSVGASPSGGNVFPGFIAGLRRIIGSGGFSATGSTITVPTAPPTAVTNTNLLLNFTNAGILDNAMMNDLETVGNAQLSTSVYKYGTGSISMTSSGDYCKGSQPSIVYDIAGGNFTIEFWVYFTSLAADRALISKYGNTAENAGGLGYVLQWVQSSSVLRLVLGIGGGSDALYTWSWAPSTSTWYHVAVTRSGTSGRAFINGTQIGSTSTVTTSDVVSPNVIQLGKTHTVAQYLLGYMDDVRITKGYARYTSNFTAPTAAFPNN